MDFITVFDISKVKLQQLFDCSITGIPFIIIFLFLVIGLNTKIFRFPDRFKNKFNRIFSICYLIFAISVTTIDFLYIYPGYFELKNAYLSNKCTITEGYVEHFRPMINETQGFEEFEVNKMKFKYSDSSETPGFNITSRHGRPIKEGVYVRIHSFKGRIAKLEIRE